MSAVEGWKIESLGRIAQLTMGQSPDSKYYSTDDKKGMPFLQGCAEFKSRFPVPSLFCSQAKKTAKSGSILFSVRAPVGKINIADRDYIIGRGLAAISGVEVDQIYLEHYLSFVEAKFRNASQGSTFEAINSSELNGWPIEYPTSKPEQSKIAEILSTVDRAIEQTEALIAKQQRIKTGLMQGLLTRGIDEHGNLRSEHTHKFKNSPLGRIPVEWDALNLSDVANYQNGKGFPSSAYRSSGVRLVRPGNLAQNGWVVWDDKHTTYLPSSFWEKALDYQVGSGEILMNLTAQSLEDQFLGRVCMTPIGNACLLNQRIARITPNSCDSNFLYWALKGPHFRDYIDSIPQGTKVQHIYNRNLDAVRLAVPKSLSEQKAVADTLWGIENKTDATLNQLLKLRSLKTALMQDLLTGKKRVTVLMKNMEVTSV
jgi:type I restriction enzyme, S subunit